MKILIVVDSYPPHHGGGYELRCKDVVTGLRERGHEVRVITTRCPKSHCAAHIGEHGIFRDLHRKGKSCRRVMRVLNDIYDLQQIKNHLILFKPDLIYLWHLVNLSDAIIPFIASFDMPVVYDEGGNGSMKARKRMSNFVYFWKSPEDSQLKKKLKTILSSTIHVLSGDLIPVTFNFPEKFYISFNSSYSKSLADEQTVPYKSAAVIHSGIDTTKFTFQPRKQIEMPVKILVPGRITKVKGTIDSIRLLRELLESGFSASLEIVGENSSAEYLQNMLSEIRTNGLSDFVSVYPMLSHESLNSYYRDSDICFFPSYQKIGLSRVPLEAMACGCVVISYGNEGSSELIQSSINGYIVPEGDIKSATKTILSLVYNPKIYNQILFQAYEQIQKSHQMRTYINSVESFLLSCNNG